MADDLSVLLSWFANYTNYYSILTVLLCFSGMVIFIFRLNADAIFSSRIAYFQNTSKFQPMSIADNPFYCELNKAKPSSSDDGVFLKISHTKPLNLYLIWGADITCLFKEYLKNTTIVTENLNSLSFMKTKCWKIEKIERLNNCTDDLHIECPSVLKNGDFGHPSRNVYPLVIIMVENKSSESDHKDNNNVEALMTIVHIKDDIATYKSFTIGHYLKLKHGEVLHLQPIFVTTSPDNDNIEENCVVCQNSAVTHVILPCKHACVCSQCFTRVNKCPMCRGKLDTYFTLTDIPNDNCQTTTDIQTESQSLSFSQRLEVLNQRLNQYLGYR